MKKSKSPINAAAATAPIEMPAVAPELMLPECPTATDEVGVLVWVTIPGRCSVITTVAVDGAPGALGIGVGVGVPG